MLAKSCPKVSLQSRLSRESYDAKFGMDESARNKYGVTLKGETSNTGELTFQWLDRDFRENNVVFTDNATSSIF